MSQKEREHFFTILCLVLNPATEAVRLLLKLYLSQNFISFERFVRQNQHEIYHLCYNSKPCCQCTGNRVPNSRRVLTSAQLEIILDKTGQKLHCHNGSRTCSEFCCSPAKSGITVNDLDITLANCLLINFCTDIFWFCCLARTNKQLDQFLDINRHQLYHCKAGGSPCCSCLGQCPVLPSNQTRISVSQWNVLFNTPATVCAIQALYSGNQRPVCAYKATIGITQSSIDFNTTSIIQEQLCPCRKHLKTLVDLRNVIAHAKSDTLSDRDFERYKTEMKNAVLEISDVCNLKGTMEEKFENLEKRSLDEQLCVQHRNVLLTQIQREGELTEIVKDLPLVLGKVVENTIDKVNQPLWEGLQQFFKNVQNSGTGEDDGTNRRHYVKAMQNSESTINDTSSNESLFDPIPGDFNNILDMTINILEHAKFVRPELGAINDLSRFLCERYKNALVRKALQKVLNDKLEEEYEADKDSFINATIFMSNLA